MLQHRGIAIDEVKRQFPRGWTDKLRSVAQFAIDNTPEEHFSSSKNIVFSMLMKERAVTSILPSLFDFSQTYEDYVHQRCLWNYADDKDIPLGKTMTWQYIRRPPKQISQRRRVRTTRTLRAPRQESDIDAHDSASGDDTEVDETMERISNNLRRQTTTQAARNDRAHQEPVIKISTPVATADGPAMSRTQSNANPNSAQSTPNSSFNHSTPGSSFNSSLSCVQFDEDAKGGSLATPTDTGLQVQHFRHPRQYQQPGYMSNTFTPMQSLNAFPNTAQMAFPPFPSSNYIDSQQFPLYNDNYPLQMNASSLGPSMTASNMLFPYAPDAMLLDTSLDMAESPRHHETSFDGLPNDFQLNGTGLQQQYFLPQLVADQRQ